MGKRSRLKFAGCCGWPIEWKSRRRAAGLLTRLCAGCLSSLKAEIASGSIEGLIEGRQSGGRLFPLGVEFCQLGLHGDQFAIDLLGFAGFIVSFLFLELPEQFGLAAFQLLDLLL